MAPSASPLDLAARRRGRRTRVIDERLHQLIDLCQVAQRLELRQLRHELIGIKRIERTLRLKLRAQQLQEFGVQAIGYITRRRRRRSRV